MVHLSTSLLFFCVITSRTIAKKYVAPVVVGAHRVRLSKRMGNSDKPLLVVYGVMRRRTPFIESGYDGKDMSYWTVISG